MLGISLPLCSYCLYSRFKVEIHTKKLVNSILKKKIGFCQCCPFLDPFVVCCHRIFTQFPSLENIFSLLLLLPPSLLLFTVRWRKMRGKNFPVMDKLNTLTRWWRTKIHDMLDRRQIQSLCAVGFLNTNQLNDDFITANILIQQQGSLSVLHAKYSKNLYCNNVLWMQWWIKLSLHLCQF